MDGGCDTRGTLGEGAVTSRHPEAPGGDAPYRLSDVGAAGGGWGEREIRGSGWRGARVAVWWLLSWRRLCGLAEAGAEAGGGGTHSGG